MKSYPYSSEVDGVGVGSELDRAQKTEDGYLRKPGAKYDLLLFTSHTVPLTPATLISSGDLFCKS